MALRIIFMGSPAFAMPTLERLREAGHAIAAVYTQPPRPAGRGMAERKSAVHVLADQIGTAVRTPINFKTAEARDEFARIAADADVGIVVAYGLLLPAAILAGPRQGCLNLHPSLLPRWRGAAPIQRTIMAGDTETAVIVMRMDEGLDTGPICLEARLAVPADATAGALHDLLADRGAALLVEALGMLEAGTLACRPQASDGVTYAVKIRNDEARIDWSRPAAAVHDHIRGLSPFPGATFEFDSGGKSERIKVLRSAPAEGTGAPGTTLDDSLTVACGSGAVRLLRLQRAGKQAMAAAELLRGLAVPAGTRLVSG